MEAERLNQLETIFQAARALPAEARVKYLDAACGSDATLRAEIESLLAHDESSWGMLAGSAAQRYANLLVTDAVDSGLEGQKIGRYHVLHRLGAGGMGEVWLARDMQLSRYIALKLLPAHSARNALLAQRLTQEAQATSALNHPNICAVYDIGEYAGQPYIVMEYLDGETLEKKLNKGPLPEKTVLTLARQIAAGLDHAHSHGVIHRDLKPANLMLTGAGLKILDFGVAKIKFAQIDSKDLTREAIQTQPGILIGTPAYMAPEQIRREPASERTDLFSFGAIVYEMLSGRKAFSGASIPELFNAILTLSPPTLADSHVNPILERTVFRCLEKSSEQRFQHVSELYFPLELAVTLQPSIKREDPTRDLKRFGLWTSALGLVFLLSVVVILVWWKSKPSQTLRYHQVTFRRGSIGAARFAPGGQAIVYDAAWEGKPSDIFESQLDTPESRALGFPNSYLASTVSSGEILLLRVHQPASTRPFQSTGTLARVALAGGTPREILANVYAAESSSDGRELAVMQRDGSMLNVQYPLGVVICRLPLDTEPQFRLAADGETLAIVRRSDKRRYLSLFTKGGKNQTSVADGYFIRSLAWVARHELVFTGYTSGEDDFGLFLTGNEGHPRLLTRFPYDLQIQDVWKQQQYLLKAHHEQSIVMFQPRRGRESNLSWLEHTHLNGLSADGNALLITEIGQGGGPHGTVCLRKTDGSPATKLCSGIALALSPDAKWALVQSRDSPEYQFIPTAAGPSHPLQLPFNASLESAKWFPDGSHVSLTVETEQTVSCFIQDFQASGPVGLPHQLANLHVSCDVISPDGNYLVASAPGQALRRYRLNDGTSTSLLGIESGESALTFNADGHFLYVADFQNVPPRARVFRIELATGKKQLRSEIVPADLAGVPKVDETMITPDGSQVAYSFHRVLNTLFVSDVH